MYIKKEVEISLLSAILNKKNDAALFWAFELYYSGFIEELLCILWRTYYEFFATLNPTLEAYLLKKKKEDLKKKEEEEEDAIRPTPVFIANMIHNLLIRKYNTDVFFLREISCNIEIEKPYLPLVECFTTNNYEMIAYYIVESNDEDIETHEKIINTALEFFISKELKPKFLKEWKKTSEIIYPINKKLIMLSRIMHYYTLLHKEIKMGKNVYINIEPNDLIMYENVLVEPKKQSYKILSLVTTYTPDVEYLSLFKVNRPLNIIKYYYHDWLYYASFSPIWKERIELFNGIINHELKKIIFDNDVYDDEEDIFYNNYGYETDEQNIEILEKNIPLIPKDPFLNWIVFYEKYKHVGLYLPGKEELEAL